MAIRTGRSILTIALVVAAMVASVACFGGSANRSTTIKVAWDQPLAVSIPGVAALTGPVGAVSGTGSATINTVTGAFPPDTGIATGGTGVDVSFAGVTLTRPLTITYDTKGKPDDAAIPIVAHQVENGNWEIKPAALDRVGHIKITTQTFSPNIPGWLHPTQWMHWLGQRMASFVGGRTAPINCPGGAPSWATILNQSSEVHTCLVSNVDPSTHAVRAEVQIKSNRGTALEVTIPPGADYTWVEGQPWILRNAVWARLIHQDPSLMVLLPPGATVTAGYRQLPETLSFQIRVTQWSMVYSLIGDLVDALTGLAADSTNTTTLYLMTKCSGLVDFSHLSVNNPIDSATFGTIFTCIIGDAVSELSSWDKAIGAARNLLGPGVDAADLDTQAKELSAIGNKLHALGWVVALWPVLQTGWQGAADTVASLVTGGASTLVNLSMQGRTNAGSGGSVGATQPQPGNSGTQASGNGGPAGTAPPPAPLPPPPAPPPPPPPPAQPIFTVMNTSEQPPDGVWFRNSAHTADTSRTTGLGVYQNEQIQLICYGSGDAVGPYNDTLWYYVTNVTRPTVNGRPDVGYLNAHYINDGKVANQVDAGVRAC
jgi:hypothetical protein